MSMTAKKLEVRWTPTTIQTTFAIPSLPSTPDSDRISVDLPLLNLGWAFSLSLNPVVEKVKSNASLFGKSGSKGSRATSRVSSWIVEVFSFRQLGTAVCWGNASIHAELSLESDLEPDSPPLGTMNIVLADTPSSQILLTTSPAILSRQSNKVFLTVTISDCPLPGGLFDVPVGPINEAEVRPRLDWQNGDGILRQSLSTGKFFDVKFLTPSTRFTSGDTGEPLPTYISHSVLAEHVDLSSSILTESWTNALAASDGNGVNHVGDREIPCPKDYEYELDSDFEDEEDSSGERQDQAVPECQPSESGSDASNSSLSSFEPVEANDQGSVEVQLAEFIKDPKEPPSNHELRTIRVKFAAHRTWQAFSWYCYTGNLEFGKLRSQVESGNRHLRATPGPLENGPPKCSPKSMYRLADLLGNKDIKAKALAAIKDSMTEANVLDESFSIFTSKYADVRKVQLEVLMRHYRSPKVKEAFLRAMELYGNMPHAKPVLSAFFDKLVA